LAAREIVKYLAQMPLYFAEQQLLAVLRREHDVVLALPGRVIKMIELHFHHGLLEGSWRFPQGDFMTLFPQLSNFLFSPRHRRGLSRFGYLGVPVVAAGVPVRRSSRRSVRPVRRSFR